MNLPAGGMLIFFALFWSTLTLLFDGLIGHTAVRQLIAQGYTITDGTMLTRSVACSEGDDGPTYRPEVTFRYRVGEQEQIGTRLSYDTMFTSGSDWAQQAIADLPPGQSVRVYYNPADPADSLLRPGLDGGLLFMGLFLTPFNAIMIFLWSVLAKALWRRWRNPPAGGLRVDLDARGASVRLEGLPALGAGLGTIAVLAFAGIFLVGFTSGFRPSLSVMTVLWIVILACGVGATFRQAARNASDRARLVVDEGNSIVDLPPTHGRTHRLQLSTTELIALHLSKELSTDNEGSSQTKYALALAAKDRARERIALWSDETQTRGFAIWLIAKLRIPLVEE